MPLRRFLLPTIVCLAALPLLAGRLHGQGQKATCPVDGKQFEASRAARTLWVNELKLQFCGSGCVTKFAAGPEKFVTAPIHCPVYTDRTVKPADGRRRIVNNNVYYLCCDFCLEDFGREPVPYLKQINDPVSGALFTPGPNGSTVQVGDQVYLFQSDQTRQAFEKDLDRYLVRYR